ncbi:MAG: ribosomal protein S18-alanine N-acetyltransferase [Syntrophomonadaceae bacterium]|nr:ribosomal protein S18-alanine N-acetyltransferase [Syntrophomonadaceae bacterium]
MLNPDFIVRKMTAQDIDEVMGIEKSSFSLPWARESYFAELRNDLAAYLVCEYEGKVAGYGGIWVVLEEAHITNVAVSEQFRRSGIGKTLMCALEKIAREKKAARIILEVRPSNSAALTMYRGLGYVPAGIRKRYYYDNGEDAIIMVKYLF